MTLDTVWWFEALRRHELLIQRCTGCGRLRHPVRPMCPDCRSLSWDTVAASGEGVVHSFVVAHHPRIPGFDYPLITALVDLAEGTRLLGNIVGCEPGEVHIGMPVTLEFIDLDDKRSAAQFRPVATPRPAELPGSAS
jgi:uncharacterized OB-fold protein